MRPGPILAIVALPFVACASFTGDDPKEPPVTTDGGSLPDAAAAESGSLVEASAPACPALNPPACNGTVRVVVLAPGSLVASAADAAAVTYSPPVVPECSNSVQMTCLEPAALSSFYVFPLDKDTKRLVLHQIISGPVVKADTNTTLTFGCGLFLTTNSGAVIQTRFEVAAMHFEIDGDNDDSSLKGTIPNPDPPGVPFTNSTDPKPNPNTPYMFDMDVTITPPVDAGLGNMATTGTIQKVVKKAGPIPFKGSIASAELRCGILNIGDGQKEKCNLTIRQIELEICAP